MALGPGTKITWTVHAPIRPLGIQGWTRRVIGNLQRAELEDPTSPTPINSAAKWTRVWPKRRAQDGVRYALPGGDSILVRRAEGAIPRCMPTDRGRSLPKLGIGTTDEHHDKRKSIEGNTRTYLILSQLCGILSMSTTKNTWAGKGTQHVGRVCRAVASERRTAQAGRGIAGRKRHGRSEGGLFASSRMEQILPPPRAKSALRANSFTFHTQAEGLQVE